MIPKEKVAEQDADVVMAEVAEMDEVARALETTTRELENVQADAELRVVAARAALSRARDSADPVAQRDAGKVLALAKTTSKCIRFWLKRRQKA